ncbi:MAG: hypothetical protein US63_C0022G0008 [Candidatus Moranbacteria bacterium GW2011_GWC2_37_8]|nr:MAG: hypothetical protein US63_C0022G0008 [Candidatus Moranbacteria bacterium GW2011_GWC2_37_8]
MEQQKIKCPLCSEMIQPDAKKCRFCGEWIEKKQAHEEVAQPTGTDNFKVEPTDISIIRILKGLGWFLLVVFALSLWYISLPILAMWYFFYKTDSGKKLLIIIKNKIKAIGYRKIAGWALLGFIVLLVFSMIITYPDRKPTITITEPSNNHSIQSDKILIKGIVSPSGSNVSLKAGDTKDIEIIDGKFSFEASLEKEIK